MNFTLYICDMVKTGYLEVFQMSSYAMGHEEKKAHLKKMPEY